MKLMPRKEIGVFESAENIPPLMTMKTSFPVIFKPHTSVCVFFVISDRLQCVFNTCATTVIDYSASEGTWFLSFVTH